MTTNKIKNILTLIHKELTRNKNTIAVAESCTGGALSRLFTKYPGSSRYFVLGIVAYSEQSKEKLLKIPRKTITGHGAVSKIVAELMAKNIRKIAKTDFSLSTTGIAGPDGAIKNTPVGTVFIAARSGNKLICRKFRFSGTRTKVITKTCAKALEILAELICAYSSP